jgi:hypothetical protein
MTNLFILTEEPSDYMLRIIPDFKDRVRLPKLEVSKKIAAFMNINNNQSVSFNRTIDAIKNLTS